MNENNSMPSASRRLRGLHHAGSCEKRWRWCVDELCELQRVSCGIGGEPCDCCTSEAGTDVVGERFSFGTSIERDSQDSRKHNLVPHCRAPFLDFSGCLALTCAGCSKDFCGVCCCQHSSTKDKHEAVRECVERLPQEERTMNDFAKLMCVPSAVLQV